MSSPKPPKTIWVLMDSVVFTPGDAHYTSRAANDARKSYQVAVPYVLAQPPAPIVSSPLTDEEKRILAEMDDDEQPKRLEDEFDIVQVSDNLVSYTPKRKLPTCRICGSVYAVAYGGGVCGPNGCENKPKRKRAKKGKTR